MRAPAIAFIGPDGAGKSTITREIVSQLDGSAVRIYMGVNLEEANVALPTTRLVLASKRRRGGRPDLAGWHEDTSPRRQTARDVARVLNLIAEEWYRAAIVAYHKRRGRVVVMDRHFIADYWHHDVAPPDPSHRTWVSRLHGHLLRHWYPKPDRVVFLDAPPEALHRRKPETSLEHLRTRRAEYRSFTDTLGTASVVSTEEPLEEVVRRCLEAMQKATES